MLIELSRTFTDEALEIMRAVQSSNHCSKSFLESTELLPLINQYSLSVAHACTQALKISEKYEDIQLH